MSLIRRHFIFALAALAAACSTTGSAPTIAPQIGLYEWRITTAEPGKMDALKVRVRDHEAPLFRKHGMTPLGFFTPSDPKDQRFYYLMGYKDRAARDAAWTAFAADPEWQAAYKAANAGGPLSSGMDVVMLNAAEYSPPVAKALTPASTPRVYELRTYTATAGKLEDVHTRFRNHTLRIFAKHGMGSVLYWRPTPGQEGYANRMMYMLSFPNQAARDAAWTEFASDPEWQKVSDESNAKGAILAGRPQSVMLQPANFSPMR